MMYYKIIYGFDKERTITIEASELEKAYGVFLLGGKAIFKEGAVDGKYIQGIQPDYHRTMGWAQEYKLGPDDYNQLSDTGIDRKARALQERTQTKVQYLIENKKESLIGKNVEISELLETKKLSTKTIL